MCVCPHKVIQRILKYLLEEHSKHPDKLKEKFEMISMNTWTKFIGDSIRDIPQKLDNFYIQVLCVSYQHTVRMQTQHVLYLVTVYIFVSDIFVI